MDLTSRDPAALREILVADLLRIMGHGPGSFKVSPLPQDASMRRYYRIEGPDLTEDPIRGSSIILMVLADPNPRAKPEEITTNGNGGPAEPELDFINVRRHFEAVGLPVPLLYHYNLDYGLLYLEDLGNQLMEDTVKGLSADDIKTYYEKAIDLMVILHENGSALKNDSFVGFKRGFNEKLLFYELKHYVEYGIEARKGIKVAPADLKVIEKHMAQIAGELAALPRVLAHRDFQSRNLMLQDGRLRIIDFQDALMGARQYDMVSLLRDSYVVLSAEVIDYLIEYYIRKVESIRNEKIDRAVFRRIFDLQTLQRKIKDAGRFDYIDIVKKNPKFLKYIPDTLGYVREAFARLPEHEPLREKLANYTPELTR